jgi:hypothetical protein
MIGVPDGRNWQRLWTKGGTAWIKGEKKNAGSAEASGFQGLTGLILSTFSPANPTRVMPV